MTAVIVASARPHIAPSPVKQIANTKMVFPQPLPLL